MKCTWCKTRLKADDRKDGRWKFAEKNNGEGYYVCPRCSKTLVARHEVSVTAPVLLFLAGALSPGIFFGLKYFGEDFVGMSEGWSLLAAAVIQIVMIAALWIRTIESVEVAT